MYTLANTPRRVLRKHRAATPQPAAAAPLANDCVVRPASSANLQGRVTSRQHPSIGGLRRPAQFHIFTPARLRARWPSRTARCVTVPGRPVRAHNAQCAGAGYVEALTGEAVSDPHPRFKCADIEGLAGTTSPLGTRRERPARCAFGVLAPGQ